MNLRNVIKNRGVTFLAGFGPCLAVLVVLPPNVSEGYVKAPRTSPKGAVQVRY